LENFWKSDELPMKSCGRSLGFRGMRKLKKEKESFAKGQAGMQGM
jgi:hypothetical protein